MILPLQSRSGFVGVRNCMIIATLIPAQNAASTRVKTTLFHSATLRREVDPAAARSETFTRCLTPHPRQMNVHIWPSRFAQIAETFWQLLHRNQRPEARQLTHTVVRMPTGSII
jgi:hypothetical protein